MGTVAIGPMSFSVDVLAMLASILLATTVGNRVARARGAHADALLWMSIACALLAARAAYVLRYSDAYLVHPSSILDLRDGGWIGWVGVTAGVAVATWLGWRRPAQRPALAAATAAGLALWTGVALIAALQPKLEVGIPAVELTTLRGEPTQLQTFGGKPLVVNLWASWCPPCRREMPLLRDAQLRHAEVNFVFVNQMESSAAVRRYLEASHIELDNVLLDQHSALSLAIRSQALPATLFFDARGRLVERRLGELSAASLAQRLARIVKVKASDNHMETQ
ncbi:prolipoprotein diacylglyceryl transferase family protein [Massilia sp. TWR1-2-2]|uniref:prolipoprotein diacylglyceryl transferase family protein n=1 Tax=Massilia sp. TWR1-2-2 TaxID=2804584 RepID=UPI003CE8A377